MNGSMTYKSVHNKKKGKRKNKKNLSKGSKVLLVFILVSCGFEKYVYHFQGMFRFNDPCGVTV